MVNTIRIYWNESVQFDEDDENRDKIQNLLKYLANRNIRYTLDRS